MIGIIRKSTGSWYDVLDEQGKVHAARITGKFRLAGKTTTNPVAVGDRVVFKIDEHTGDVLIQEVLPRTNYLIRKANNLSRQEHIIAANVDQVLIVATLALPRTSQGFIDRILVTAEAYSLKAIIVFNKVDLFTPEIMEMQAPLEKMYNHLGYTCFPISVKTGLGIDRVETLLKDKTTLITGHSGVGKSSLLNRLVPDLELKTREISGSSLKGKHTTTFAEMHLVNEETRIIDTPGIKEFGIVDMKKEEVSHYFPEMLPYLENCRFRNCIHVNEPGCAVLDAVEDGHIYGSRYASYLSIISNEESHK